MIGKTFDVPPGGLRGVRVVVPELCEVVARAVDAHTGAVLLVEQIGWSRFEVGLATFGERAPGSEGERAEVEIALVPLH